MVWASRNRKASDGSAVAGLDINAGRARAAFGAIPPPRPLRLSVEDEELPLAIGLEHRTPTVGAQALSHRCSAPHWLCERFLPHLGLPRSWGAGRYKLDAAGALRIALEHVREKMAGVAGVAITHPAYITHQQAQLLSSAAESAKLPVMGAAPLPLAVAGYDDHWRSAGVFLDADDHCATWSVVTSDGKHVRLVGSQAMAACGIRMWVDRLMKFLADRCIHVCRRDPRDSAMAEQALDEQISEYLAGPRATQPLAITVRTEHWYQNLSISPEDAIKACGILARTAADALRPLVEEHKSEVCWITSAAARLPGLIDALSIRLPERSRLKTLTASAPAEAAHLLALRRLHGELPAGLWDHALPRSAAAPERLTVR